MEYNSNVHPKLYFVHGDGRMSTQRSGNLAYCLCQSRKMITEVGSRPQSLPDYTTSDPRRRLSSQSLPRGPPRVTFATLSQDELFSVSSPKCGNAIKVAPSKPYSVYTSDTAFVKARIAKPVRFRAEQLRNPGSISDRGKYFSSPPPPKAFRQALGPTQSPIQFVFGLFPRVGTWKWPGREAKQSLRSTAQVKNEWDYTSTPSYIFMTCTMTRYPCR